MNQTCPLSDSCSKRVKRTLSLRKKWIFNVLYSLKNVSKCILTYYIFVYVKNTQILTYFIFGSNIQNNYALSSLVQFISEIRRDEMKSDGMGWDEMSDVNGT